jgi:hypothetical protein
MGTDRPKQNMKRTRGKKKEKEEKETKKGKGTARARASRHHTTSLGTITSLGELATRAKNRRGKEDDAA